MQILCLINSAGGNYNTTNYFSHTMAIVIVMCLLRASLIITLLQIGEIYKDFDERALDTEFTNEW